MLGPADGLENRRPKGHAGSNPAPSVLQDKDLQLECLLHRQYTTRGVTQTVTRSEEPEPRTDVDLR